MMVPKSTAPLSRLRKAYLSALCIGDDRQADRVLDGSIEQGVSVNQIYLEIMQPAAYDIGALWQRNLVTVGQEHLATAIIERQMGQLHPHFIPRTDKGRTLVLGCVEGELHRVGARMVADFFEQDGWSVAYLGASTPIEEIVGIAREVQADLIGISTQLTLHLPRILELVNTLDRRGMTGLPIIAGGQPFIQQPDLYKTLNIRFSAPNAALAVAQANRLFEGT
jgi:methylmalonyl-CoA mutase cobalamin-binding domain/chain